MAQLNYRDCSRREGYALAAVKGDLVQRYVRRRTTRASQPSRTAQGQRVMAPLSQLRSDIHAGPAKGTVYQFFVCILASPFFLIPLSSEASDSVFFATMIPLAMKSKLPTPQTEKKSYTTYWHCELKHKFTSSKLTLDCLHNGAIQNHENTTAVDQCSNKRQQYPRPRNSC